MRATRRMQATKKNGMTVVIPALPQRNPIIATLAKQGLHLGAGKHQRSTSGQRRADKVALQKMLDQKK